MNKTPKLRFKEFSGEWKSKKVASVFDRVSNKVDVIENGYYEQIGIRSHGKGIFYKESVSGKELGNKRVFWVEPDVFIVNIVFAWEQAVAKTTQNEVGMIASHRFPMYKPKENMLDLDYITQLFKTPKGKFLLGLASPGGAGRNKTLGQKEFDDLDIIIPSYEEQKKISSFISLIDKKIIKQGEKVEVLKDYKKGMMQKIFSRELRFKDDDGRDYPEWKHKKLSNIVTRVTRKNKEIQSTLPLTISAQYGLVDQITFFNKTVASSNLEGYYLLEKGEFAYNKSYSTGYPFGAIKRLDRYDKGVLSSLYICFSVLENIDSDFLVQYFETSCWHKEISMIAVEGARNHGLLNISVSDFFDTYHWIPSYEEQIKIGQFLGSLDMKLRKEQEKLDSLNEYKKGLLQQMFV